MRDADISLDVVRAAWYLSAMNKLVRIMNFDHMTRFGRAVEGVAR